MEEKKAAGAATGSDAKIAKNDYIAKNPTRVSKPVRAIGLPQRVHINKPLLEGPTKWNPADPSTIPPEDLKEFPVWGLPDKLQQFIKTIADGHQCSPSIPTAAVFSAAGTATGKSVTGRFDNYITYPANWFVIVGKASSGKTGAAERVYKPLMDYEEKAYNDYLVAREAYNSQPKDQRGEPPRLQSRIEGLMTDEKLLYKLGQNNGALCWKHGELEALFGGMGRYSKGGAGMIVGCLEDMFSHSTLQRSTIGSEPIFVKEPALNIFTTTQPVKIRQLMRPFVIGRGGFFERFLYVHVTKLKERKQPTIIGDEVMAVWSDCIDRLTHLEPFTMTENEQAADLHKKAREYWEGLGDTLDEDGSDDDFDDVRSSCYYKANYHVCRLAMITAILNGETVINAPAMAYAIHCTQYLLANQLFMLSLITKDDCRGQSVTMKEVCRYLMERGKKQTEIAKFLGITRQTINGYVNANER